MFVRHSSALLCANVRRSTAAAQPTQRPSAMIPKQRAVTTALLQIMVLISVGQSCGAAAAASASVTNTINNDVAATSADIATSSSPASSAVSATADIFAPGPGRDGVLLFTEFASPSTTSTTNANDASGVLQSNQSSTNSHTNVNNVDEQLMVLTEKVINFDTESTAPPLNELTSNGAVARDPNNGMFRIKIAEIITDEFDNGLMPASSADADADAAYDRRRLAAAAYNTAGNIKLADLYPSKLEDFGPIIRQSNERLINDKHVFVQEGVSEDGTAMNDAEELRGHVVLNSYEPSEDADDARSSGSRLSQSRMPSTKIEIELIDDVDEPSATAGRVSDFTRELLRDNDGVINTIERSYVNVAPKNAGETIRLAGSINQALDTSGLIERRVKKLDPLIKRPHPEEHHVAKVSMAVPEEEQHSTKEKPEFSTTKFYNSKVLYSELMHKQLPDALEATVTATTTTTAEPSTTAEVTIDSVSSTSAEPTSIVSTTKHFDKTKTVNINTPKTTQSNKLKKLAKKVIALGKTTTVINKAKSTPKITVATGATTTTTAQPISENSHLQTTTLISDESVKERPPTSILTTITAIRAATEKPDMEAAASDTPAVSISTTSPVITTDATATTTTQAAVRHIAMVRPPVHDAPKHHAAARLPSTLSRLQEKLNALECEMPGDLAPDVNVWRGNETHDLNLPNTVSEQHLCFRDYPHTIYYTYVDNLHYRFGHTNPRSYVHSHIRIFARPYPAS